MAKTLLFSILMIFSIGMYAQNNIDYSEVKLETDEDFRAAEPIVLNAANYVLSNPSNTEDNRRIHAVQLIMSWMEGNPDYMFNLHHSIDKFNANADISVKIVYIAAFAKYYLENKENAIDTKLMKLNPWKITIQYAENPDNKVVKTKKLKKLIEASKKGDFYLDKELE